MRAFVKKWDFFLAVAVSVTVGFALDYGLWKNISNELITFFGIQAAAVLPSMIFAAGLLRPVGEDLQELQKYKKALERQAKFWISLLALDFISVIVLILGKAIDWQIKFSVTVHKATIGFAEFANALTTFFIILTCLRMIPMIKGIVSLQQLNAKMVEDAMALEIKKKNKTQAKTSKKYTKPKSFGRVVKK